MSEWSHLANAKHIDRIIAHVDAHPTAWEEAAYNAAYDAANDDDWAAIKAAYDAAWDALYDAAPVAVIAAYDAASVAARAAAVNDATRAEILALVAWDHAGGLMDLPAEQVLVLALLGYQAAILLYPAIAAMETRCRLTI